MEMTTTEYTYIGLDEAGVPVIEGTTTKVIEVVVEHLVWQWRPEAIHIQHPYLSLGQIYSALAYYYDHTEELDRDIEERFEHVARVYQAAQLSNLKERLRATALLS